MDELTTTVTQSTSIQNPLVDANTNNEIDRLDELAVSINKKQGEIEGHANGMIFLASDIGAQLDEAKSAVKHGQWKSWVAENISFGHKQAAKYIRLYNNRDFLAKGPSEGFLTSIDAAVTFIKSEKKKLEAPEPVNAKSPPEAETPVEQYSVDDEGVEGFSFDEACDVAGEDRPKGTDKLGDVSNDTSAVETDDEPSDDTPLFSKSRARETHTINGDYSKVDSAPTEDAESEKQKKHATAESKPSGPIQESKSTQNKAELEKVTKQWTDDLVKIELSASKYTPILKDKIRMDLMDLALKFEKKNPQSDTKR